MLDRACREEMCSLISKCCVSGLFDDIHHLVAGEDACREDKLWLDFIRAVEGYLRGKVAGTYHVRTPMDDMKGIDPGEFSMHLDRFLEEQAPAENDSGVFLYQGIASRIHKFLDRGSSVEFGRYDAADNELVSEDTVREFIRRNLGDIPDKFAQRSHDAVETHLVCYNTFDALIRPERLLDLLREEIEILHRDRGACIDYAHVMVGHPPILDDTYVFTVSTNGGAGI